MTDDPVMSNTKLRLELQHRVFSTLGDVRFRRSDTDGTPVLAMTLGEREAQIPLDALQREVGIASDSPDGRMLELIAAALDHVPSLQPGDRLPSEVLSGRASWRPSPDHLRLAGVRLRLNLVAWLSPKSHWAKAKRDGPTLLRLADDPALSREVQAAALAAARLLGLGDAAQLLGLLTELSEEMSYIEALRERLLARVEALCRQVSELQGTRKHGGTLGDTLSQVHRLARLAFHDLRVRFDDVDAITSAFDTLARNLDGLRSFIRNTRDYLYRNQRAWEPLLRRGDAAAGVSVSGLLTATYQFLAQRSMPTTAWQGRPQNPAAPGNKQPPRGSPGGMQIAW